MQTLKINEPGYVKLKFYSPEERWCLPNLRTLREATKVVTVDRRPCFLTYVNAEKFLCFQKQKRALHIHSFQ